jgi:hypothetical protein
MNKFYCNGCNQTWPSYESYHNHNCPQSSNLLETVTITRKELNNAINNSWTMDYENDWIIDKEMIWDILNGRNV